jgi:hypothetical protein
MQTNFFFAILNTFFYQELVAKSIESSDLNFSRYGDTFFEVQPVEQYIPWNSHSFSLCYFDDCFSLFLPLF